MINTVEPPARDHPKCQSQVVAYESLDNKLLGWNFVSLVYGNFKTVNFISFTTDSIQCMCIFSFNIFWNVLFNTCKKSILEKNMVLSVYFTTQECNIVTTAIIQILLYYLSSGHLREVKNKRKFQTSSLKSACGCLWEVVAYKRFQVQWFNLEMFCIVQAN